MVSSALPRLASPAWLDRVRARVLLGAVLVLVGLGCLPAPQAEGPSKGTRFGDVDLYREVADRVAAGADYYSAAITAQLVHGYPTTPFLAVRLPTLNYLHLWLGDTGATVLLAVLGLAGLIAIAVRLDRIGVRTGERLAVVTLLALGVALLAVDPVAWFHEAWAGTLVILAIAVHSDRRWWPSVVTGLAAVCFRELALPFLVVMAVLAWPRRRRESLAWIGAIAVFAILYAGHALAVQAAQPPIPVASDGWLSFGGWQFVLACVRMGSILSVAPLWLAVVLVPLALLGWFFVGELSGPVLGTCGALIVIFMVAGRPDNTYWGLLFASLLVCGLAFAPRGLTACVRTAFPRAKPPGAVGSPRSTASTDSDST